LAPIDRPTDGEGANDALLFALARDVLANWAPDRVPAEWRSPTTGGPVA
jgi:hypothetical protein